MSPDDPSRRTATEKRLLPARRPRPSAPRVLVIAGPTAAGKTALALRLCGARPIYDKGAADPPRHAPPPAGPAPLCSAGAEIVNADSVQVYRGLDVGSDKASLEERGGVPHHLLDDLDPADSHDVVTFAHSASAALDDIVARGRAPVVVGGTGFYLWTLINGTPKTGASELPRGVGGLGVEGGASAVASCPRTAAAIEAVEAAAREAEAAWMVTADHDRAAVETEDSTSASAPTAASRSPSRARKAADARAANRARRAAGWAAACALVERRLGDPETAARLLDAPHNWTRLRRAVEALIQANPALFGAGDSHIDDGDGAAPPSGTVRLASLARDTSTELDFDFRRAARGSNRLDRGGSSHFSRPVVHAPLPHCPPPLLADASISTALASSSSAGSTRGSSGCCAPRAFFPSALHLHRAPFPSRPTGAHCGRAVTRARRLSDTGRDSRPSRGGLGRMRVGYRPTITITMMNARTKTTTTIPTLL